MQGIIRTARQNPVVIPEPERPIRTMGKRPVRKVSSCGEGEVPYFPHPFSAGIKEVGHFRKNLGFSRLPVFVFPHGNRHETVIHCYPAESQLPVFRHPTAVKGNPRYGTVQIDFQGLPSPFLFHLPRGVRHHIQAVPRRFQNARVPGQKARYEITVADIPERRKFFPHWGRSLQHLFHGQMFRRYRFRRNKGLRIGPVAHAAKIIPC